MSAMAFQVPNGAQPGQMMLISTPDGQQIQVQIPPGAMAGQQIQVQYQPLQRAQGVAVPAQGFQQGGGGGGGGGGGYFGGSRAGSFMNRRGGDAVGPAPEGNIQGAKVHEAMPDIRRGFIRKVYGILCIQLLVTTLVVAKFIPSSPIGSQDFTNSMATKTVYYTAIGVSIVTLIALLCCGETARIFPQNYILLAVFTVAEGFLLGVICAYKDTDVIFQALGMTVIVVVGLSIFASQTKIDFTDKGGYLFVALLVLMVMGIFSMISGGAMRTVYAGFGCMLFGFYLVYDTQLILGGSHATYQFGLDDYVFGALSLYLDIVNMFMFLLMLLDGGGRSGD